MPATASLFDCRVLDLRKHHSTMQPKPLPDFRNFRLKCRLACAGLLGIAWMVPIVLYPDILINWGFFGAVYVVILFGLQGLSLAGDGAPNLPLPAYAVHLLAMVFGILDAALAWAWVEILAIILDFMGLSVGWLDAYGGWFIFGGLVTGWMAFLYIGLVFPRFEFLRMVLWMHMFAFGLLLASHLYGTFGEWQLADEDTRFTMERIHTLGVIGFISLALWGVAPAAYLWAYRHYRARLKITELQIEDDDLDFPSKITNQQCDHAPNQSVQTA